MYVPLPPPRPTIMTWGESQLLSLEPLRVGGGGEEAILQLKYPFTRFPIKKGGSVKEIGMYIRKRLSSERGERSWLPYSPTELFGVIIIYRTM